MIGEYTLNNLGKKYGIDFNHLLERNNQILTHGEYDEIDEVLNYLINILKISVKNIEKCPSVLYRNVYSIRKNVEFLKSKKINFKKVENCLHILSTEPDKLIETYIYVELNYGLDALKRNITILSCPKDTIIMVESLNLPHKYNLTIASSISFGMQSFEEVKKILHSKEYKEHPELFSSVTLARAKISDIKELLSSEEYKEHPELFNASVLASTKISDIKELLHSEEYKTHPELFKPSVIINARIEDIKAILHSK